MRKTVHEARQRVYDLSKTQAQQMAETTQLGRLEATGEISRVQLEAGQRYHDIVREYDRVMGARPVPSAGNLERQAGHQGEESAAERDLVQRAKRNYRTCWQALFDASREDPFAAQVVHAVILGDWYMPRMVAPLRVGLNHLARALRLSEVGVDTQGKSKHRAALVEASAVRRQAGAS